MIGHGQTSAQVSGQYTSVENPPWRATEAACAPVAATKATNVAAIAMSPYYRSWAGVS